MDQRTGRADQARRSPAWCALPRFGLTIAALCTSPTLFNDEQGAAD